MNGYRKFTGALFKVNDVISKVELLLMSISILPWRCPSTHS